jgi:hypothetical protein
MQFVHLLVFSTQWILAFIWIQQKTKYIGVVLVAFRDFRPTRWKSPSASFTKTKKCKVFPTELFFLEVCQDSPSCPSGNSNIYMKISMEKLWNGTDWGQQKNSEKNLFQCHLVEHKCHMHWHGFQPGPLWSEAGDWPPESWRDLEDRKWLEFYLKILSAPRSKHSTTML